MALNIAKTGVIVVDVQGDFTHLKQGSLPVQDTDQPYIDKVISATRYLKKKGYKIFATQDFHPKNHISFYTSHENKVPYETIEIDGRLQMLWPPHCVQGTRNADLLIDTGLFEAVIKKGTNAKYDSYSGFFDDNGMETGLEKYLISYQIDTLIVYGLAMDYCVKASVMDALASGFQVILVEDLCKGVADNTTLSAVQDMKSKGAKIVPDIYETL